MIKIDKSKLRLGILMGNAVTTKALMICAGWYYGTKLDKKFGTQPWFMLGLVVLAMTVGVWFILWTAKKNKLS